MVVQIFSMAPQGLHREGCPRDVEDSQATFMKLVAFMGLALQVSLVLEDDPIPGGN